MASLINKDTPPGVPLYLITNNIKKGLSMLYDTALLKLPNVNKIVTYTRFMIIVVNISKATVAM